MLFYVISKRNEKGILSNVMFSKDPKSAEFLLNILGNGFILTQETEKPLYIPEFTINDHFNDILMQDETSRRSCKCCMNCNSCYEEYGYTMCKHDEMTEDADPNNFVCEKWN